MRFGEILIQAGLIDKVQLDSALAHQEGTGQRIGESLLTLGVIEEDVLIEQLAKQLRVRFLGKESLARLKIPAEALEAVPHKMAEEHLLLPLAIDRSTSAISVLTCEPQNSLAIEELRIVSGLQKVFVYLAAKARLEELIARHYAGEGASEVEVDIDVEAPAPQVGDPSLLTPIEPQVGDPSLLTPVESAEGSLLSEAGLIELLDVLIGLVETPRTHFQGHSARVCGLARSLVDMLGRSADERGQVQIAGYLHDLGKPGGVHLTLPGIAGSREQRRLALRDHAVTAKLLENVQLPPAVEEILTHLYECYDGSGLPSKQRGDSIPLGSRIIALVDAYEDLISNPANPIGGLVGPDDAVRRLADLGGKLFDPRLVALLGQAIDAQAAETGLPTPNPVVLVADPDRSATAVLELKLAKQGFRIRVVSDSSSALEILESQPVAALITEMHLGPGSGFDLLEHIRSEGRPVPVFMTSSDTSPESVNRALVAGVVDFFSKPFVPDVVIAKIQMELKRPSQPVKPAISVASVAPEGTVSADMQAAGTDPGLMPSTPKGTMAGVVSTDAKFLSGSLEDRRALSLIKAISGRRMTGLLSLRHGDSKGTIYFEQGHVFQATAGDIQDEEAFLELSAWYGCLYKFEPDQTRKTRYIKTHTGKLIRIASMALESG
ncbi:MAG: response regulator [Deltaproteobacteria bacterium]|nr:response regulator [Deltaproteobacteria bacterium]